jgi:integrase
VLHRVASGLQATTSGRPRGEGSQGVWTAAECRAFLVGAADDRLYAAWALAVVCGMRRSELAGLKWSKVDSAAEAAGRNATEHLGLRPA